MHKTTVYMINVIMRVSPLPKSNKHLISPNNITPESHITVTRIKEKITKTDSPPQCIGKCIENSKGNIHTDVRVLLMKLKSTENRV